MGQKVETSNSFFPSTSLLLRKEDFGPVIDVVESQSVGILGKNTIHLQLLFSRWHRRRFHDLVLKAKGKVSGR